MLVICRSCSEAVEFTLDARCPRCRHRSDRLRAECDCLGCCADRLLEDVRRDEPIVAGGCGRKASELRDQAAVNLVCSISAATLGLLAYAVIRFFL